MSADEELQKDLERLSFLNSEIAKYAPCSSRPDIDEYVNTLWDERDALRGRNMRSENNEAICN